MLKQGRLELWMSRNRQLQLYAHQVINLISQSLSHGKMTAKR
jgi:hypothetical protein